MTILFRWMLCLLFVGDLAQAQIQPEARAYLDQALEALQTHFIRREQVDWADLRKRVHEAAPSAKVPADTYPAIRLAFERLGERHSFFITPVQNYLYGRTSLGMRIIQPENMVASVLPNSPAAKAGILPGDVIVAINPRKATNSHDNTLLVRLRRGEGFLEVNLPYPALLGNPVPTAQRFGKVGYLELPRHGGHGWIEGAGWYGDLAQKAIAKVDQSPTCGWVVDLRRNAGGNMWPMLVGAGPILGEGMVGSFINGSERSNWFYKNGTSTINEVVISKLEEVPAYVLKNPKPPVAVLISRTTASSGEATLIAFIGRENTRFFGEASNGIPTANMGVALPDGAVLIITTSYMADRTGKTYNERIQPDQAVGMDRANFATDKDPVLNAALAWLQTQAACK